VSSRRDMEKVQVPAQRVIQPAQKIIFYQFDIKLKPTGSLLQHLVSLKSDKRLGDLARKLEQSLLERAATQQPEKTLEQDTKAHRLKNLSRSVGEANQNGVGFDGMPFDLFELF